MTTHSELVARLEGASEGSREYLASSRRDMIELAWAVECVKVEDEAVVAAHIIQNRLMIVNPWWFRVAVWLIKKRPNAFAGLVHFYTVQREEARHLLTETARHIRHGIDLEETSSVGGFSQREVNLMTRILRAKEPQPDGEKT